MVDLHGVRSFLVNTSFVPKLQTSHYQNITVKTQKVACNNFTL